MKAIKAARASSDFSRCLEMLPLLAHARQQRFARAEHQVAGDLQRLRRFRGDEVRSLHHRRLEFGLPRRRRRSARPPSRARRKSLRRARAAQKPAGGRGWRAASRLEPASGTRPRSTKGVRKTVRGVAKVRSQCRLSVVPMPTAMPSTPETIGFCDPASARRKFHDFQPALAAGRDRHEIVEVVAGRKGARIPRGRHARGLSGSASPSASACGHRLIHGAGERILLVRAVHADHLDRPAALDDDMLRHVPASSAHAAKW